MPLLHLYVAALRSRAASLLFALVLVWAQAALFRLQPWLVLLGWLAVWLLAVAIWFVGEGWLFGLIGCRQPSPPEVERLKRAHSWSESGFRVAEDDAPWVAPGLRHIVVSRGALEVFDDAELAGMLAHASAQARSASAAGRLLAWLGTLPLALLQLVGRFIGQFGRVIATEFGTLLVVPVLIWPDGFVRVAGAAFGSVLVVLTSCLFIAGGLVGIGIGLLLGWVVMPALRWIAAWETRRIASRSDQAAVRNGFGQHLIAAVELLRLLTPSVAPTSVAAHLLGFSSPTQARIERLWQLVTPTMPEQPDESQKGGVDRH